MLKNIMKLADTSKGKIILSLILGFGLASIFRKVCNDRNCLVFKAPPMNEVLEGTYKHGGKCYQFKENSVTCDAKKKMIDIA